MIDIYRQLLVWVLRLVGAGTLITGGLTVAQAFQSYGSPTPDGGQQLFGEFLFQAIGLSTIPVMFLGLAEVLSLLQSKSRS
jgi:hypothetical protein